MVRLFRRYLYFKIFDTFKLAKMLSGCLRYLKKYDFFIETFNDIRWLKQHCHYIRLWKYDNIDFSADTVSSIITKNSNETIYTPQLRQFLTYNVNKVNAVGDFLAACPIFSSHECAAVLGQATCIQIVT